MKNQETKLKIFLWDLSHYTPSVQLCILATGTIIWYILSGFFLEKVFQMPGFVYGWYFTAVQFLEYSLLASFQRGRKRKVGSLISYLIIATGMVASMGLANTSVIYLGFPVMQLFKCCKLVPIMIGGRIIMNNIYSWPEIISAFLLSFGLILVSVEKSQTEILSLNPIGITLVTGALFADGAYGNLQENLMKKHKVTKEEMALFSHLIGFVILLIIQILTNELIPAFLYCYENPITYFWMTSSALTGYIGLAFVLGMINLFGTFIAMTVTSLRKFATIFLSFLIFPKPISLHFILATFFVFCGVFLHIYSKNRRFFWSAVKNENLPSNILNV